jgi:hypothetical protein
MDDENKRQASTDDTFVPPDDIYNPARDQEHLEEDGDTPAAPATDDKQGAKLPDDHPERDYASDHDAHEVYDEGELEEPRS